MITGADLKLLRLTAQLTQQELAEKLGKGYNKFYVSAVENGSRTIGFNMLTNWSNACDYDWSIVFTKRPVPGPPITGEPGEPILDLEPGDE